MYLGHTNNKFVCISDCINAKMDEFNRVIYNPCVSRELNKSVIRNELETRYEAQLSDSTLNELTQYDEYHLDDFIDHIRNVIGRLITEKYKK